MSLFSPVCICNWKQHKEMNEKILQHASAARLVQRTLAPRPMAASRCTTHRGYEPVETVCANATTTTLPPRRADVNQQFAQLTDVQSKLQGLCRTSAYNSMPLPAPLVTRGRLRGDVFSDATVANLRGAKTGACYYTTASAQARSPFMANAPQCQPAKAEDDVHLWQNRDTIRLTERPRWNNHPYALETLAVRRHLIAPPLPFPTQNPFANNTRRKLTIR